jgi:hypothetical protein
MKSQYEMLKLSSKIMTLCFQALLGPCLTRITSNVVVSKGQGCSFTGRRAHAKAELSMGSYSIKVCIQPRTSYVRNVF